MDATFPFADCRWVYSTFTLLVLGILALDLGVFHAQTHEVSGLTSLAIPKHTSP